MTIAKPSPQNPDAGVMRPSVKAQARLRVLVGLPVIIATYIGLTRAGTNSWVELIGTMHILYIALLVVVAGRLRPSSLPKLAYLTAVLDPLLLSAWLPLMGKYGGLVLGLYLFTILGFGFRSGRSYMHVCQAASILGLSAAMVLTPYWRQNPIIWSSFVLALLVVPLYATALLKKLHEARVHAEQANRAKSELLARVSHELRTPLSGIMAATQLLAAETRDRQAARRAETIFDLSQELLKEINDLLDQSKYEAKALLLESVPFELNDQIERVRLILEPTAAKKGIAFRVLSDRRIVSSVQGDPHYLTRVLVNLAGNAVKFTERGEVCVSMRLLNEDAIEYRVRLSVQDTGIGIPREFQEKIFEPFFQGSLGTTRRHGGTGLGMTIAKEIVNLMGSDLRVESEPGKGSLFYFDLRLQKAQAAEKSTEQSDFSPILGKRIFIADDNETNLMLLKELLEQDRHQVATARNGMESLEILSAREFDVMFLDFNMGDMDGAKVLQIYRFGQPDAAPAFILTADATAATTSRLQDSGAVGILNKPITAKDLRLAIAQVCQQGAGTEAGPGALAEPEIAARPARPLLKTVPIQYIDRTVIEELKSISGRPHFLGEMLAHAEQDIRRNCDDLVQALRSRDFGQVRKTAHALKGVCASIGATRLVSLSSGLMSASCERQDAATERIVAEITEVSSASLEAIRDLIAEQTAQHSSGPLASLLQAN